MRIYTRRHRAHFRNAIRVSEKSLKESHSTLQLSHAIRPTHPLEFRHGEIDAFLDCAFVKIHNAHATLEVSSITFLGYASHIGLLHDLRDREISGLIRIVVQFEQYSVDCERFFHLFRLNRTYSLSCLRWFVRCIEDAEDGLEAYCSYDVY